MKCGEFGQLAVINGSCKLGNLGNLWCKVINLAFSFGIYGIHDLWSIRLKGESRCLYPPSNRQCGQCCHCLHTNVQGG